MKDDVFLELYRNQCRQGERYAIAIGIAIARIRFSQEVADVGNHGAARDWRAKAIEALEEPFKPETAK